MKCVCEVVQSFGGPLDFVAAHPWLSIFVVLAVGWGVAQLVSAVRGAK